MSKGSSSQLARVTFPNIDYAVAVDAFDSGALASDNLRAYLSDPQIFFLASRQIQIIYVSRESEYTRIYPYCEGKRNDATISHVHLRSRDCALCANLSGVYLQYVIDAVRHIFEQFDHNYDRVADWAKTRYRPIKR